MSSAKYVSSDEKFEIDILNTCTISAVAELDITGSEPDLDISAIASIYKLSGKYTFSILNLSLTFEGALNVGAIGAGIEWDAESSQFKITPPGIGVIPTFGIDFDST